MREGVLPVLALGVGCQQQHHNVKHIVIDRAVFIIYLVTYVVYFSIFWLHVAGFSKDFHREVREQAFH